jgi:hypothetical protein
MCERKGKKVETSQEEGLGFTFVATPAFGEGKNGRRVLRGGQVC